MLGMHPIFTLFGTVPDLSTATGAANYVRQLQQIAGLHVMLVRPGTKMPWDTRKQSEREKDQEYWERLRAEQPELELPEKMGGFYLASNQPKRTNKLIKSAYALIEGKLAERDYLRNRRDMAHLRRCGETNTDAGFSDERLAELQAAFVEAQEIRKGLLTASGNAPRKGKKREEYDRCGRLIAGEGLSKVEENTLQSIENDYQFTQPNFAVEVGSSNVVVADCDTTDEVEWFKQWAAEKSGDPRWLDTLPTVNSPGVQQTDGVWKHKGGGHFWFSIGEGATAEDGTPINPLPNSIRSVTVQKPGSDVQFTLMCNRAYVLIPPSVRPEGAYVACGPSHDMPGWLYRYIISAEVDKREKAEKRRWERENREGLDSDQIDALEQWYNDMSWAEILEPHGWTYYDTDSCGCPIFSRPGYSNPKSATAHVPGCRTHSDSIDPPIHFWTTNPGSFIETAIENVGEGRSLSKLQLFAAVECDGDMSAALNRSIGAVADNTRYEIIMATPTVAMVRTIIDESNGTDTYIAPDMSAFGARTETTPPVAPAPSTTPAPATPPAPAPATTPAPATLSNIMDGDDYTYEASEEDEEELPPPDVPMKKGDVPVYKTQGQEVNLEFKSINYLRRHTPPVRFLIRDWIQENTVSLIVGPSNAGKSAVVIDMLCTMAAEYDEYESDYTMWMGYKAKRRNVLYVAGEGASGVINRITAWELHHGRSVNDHLTVLDHAFPFTSPESKWVELGERVKSAGVDIVVFDTLAMMSAGIEENSNMEMGRVMSWLENFRRNTDTTVILVHHTSKNSENPQARGASALTGAVASSIMVTKTDPETLDVEQRNRFAEKYITPIRVQVVKQKDGRYPDCQELTLVPAPVPPRLDEDGNELPDVDDFGDEKSMTTVLLGDAMGVIPLTSAPTTTLPKPEKKSRVDADFIGAMLKEVVERVVTVTTGNTRNRRMVDATRNRIRTAVELTFNYYLFGVDRNGFDRGFESALDIAFNEGVFEYEGSHIIPSHTLGVDRTDKDAVRTAIMDRLGDHVSTTKFVADEGTDPTDPDDPTDPTDPDDPNGGGTPPPPTPPQPSPYPGVAAPPSPDESILPDSEKRRGSLNLGSAPKLPSRQQPVVRPTGVNQVAQQRTSSPVGGSLSAPAPVKMSDAAGMFGVPSAENRQTVNQHVHTPVQAPVHSPVPPTVPMRAPQVNRPVTPNVSASPFPPRKQQVYGGVPQRGVIPPAPVLNSGVTQSRSVPQNNPVPGAVHGGVHSPVPPVLPEPVQSTVKPTGGNVEHSTDPWGSQPGSNATTVDGSTDVWAGW